jgi:hypothetical protein
MIWNDVDKVVINKITKLAGDPFAGQLLFDQEPTEAAPRRTGRLKPTGSELHLRGPLN